MPILDLKHDLDLKYEQKELGTDYLKKKLKTKAKTANISAQW